MRIAFFAFILSLFSLVAHAQPGKVVDLKSKTVALVKFAEDNSTHVYCSGVWIGKDRIVTAAHCVDEFAIGEAIDYVVESDVFAPATFEPREEITHRKAEIASINTDKDLATLRALAPPAHLSAEIAKSAPAYGAEVQAVGHGKGMWWSFVTGNVSAIRVMDGVLIVQSTAPVSPGYSGGGLFDTNGRLVGVTSRGRAEYHINLFVSSTEIGK